MERIVQCLSPVHIGAGKELEPLDYVIVDGRYSRVYLDAVLERLNPEEADALTAWISDQADGIEAAKGKQRDDIRQKTQLVNFPKVDLRTAFRTDATLARYHGAVGVDIERNLPVREQAKDADDTPCIPGSSLKGALRAALAFAALKDMGPDERPALKDSLDSVVRRAEEAKRRGAHSELGRRKEHIGREIEQAVFRCGKRQRDQVNYGDIHYDLMRTVLVSDTYNAQAKLIVPQIQTFVEQCDPKGNARLAPQVGLLAEAHAPGNTFRLRLQIDSRLLRAISRNRDKSRWINFEQRVRRAFGSEVAQLLPDAADEQIEQAVIHSLESAVRRFTRAVVAAEQDWAKRHGHGATSALQKFYKDLDSLVGKGFVPLRLGWGSHFLATTVLLALKEDAGWRSVLERCFRAFDIGTPPNQRRELSKGAERKIDLDDFPRSRRLVTAGKKPVAPLGWIVLVPIDAELPGPLVKKEGLIQPQGGGATRHVQIASESRDPAVEEARRIRRQIENLGGRGDVSKMDEIVGGIERLSDAKGRCECAQWLREWLKKGGKKSLWKEKKHAAAKWRRKLDSLLADCK